MRIALTLGLQAFAVMMLYEAGRGRHQYGYYRNLRLIVTAACLRTVYLLLSASLKHVRHAAWIFGAGAFLFNPIVPIYLGRANWRPIDNTMGAPLVAGASIVAVDTLSSKLQPHDRSPCNDRAPRHG